ncbi:MAG: flagellar biosynthesis protein FlhB [Lachnospiraceae bacterium]|nr:flagellar biosynthesis protein FlhB [Lachnospiraceae bacterium]
MLPGKYCRQWGVNVVLEYNLQFFAKDGPGGEKTEAATQKKLEDARKEGQVAKSKELNTALSLMALFLILKIWVGNLGTDLLTMFQTIYNKIPDLSRCMDGQIPTDAIGGLIANVLLRMLVIILPIFAVGVLVAFLGDYMQVKWKPTTKPLQPKFSKMNPIKGMKKLFSVKSLVELLKSAVKIGFIIMVVYNTLKNQWKNVFLMYDISLNQGIAMIGSVAVDMGLRVSEIYLAVSLLDFLYERWKFGEDMKMTKQEVKDEYKNSEGDPQIKGKIRQKMREASQRRMMQELPKADVVITNPTHFAVALKYDPEISDAPIVVAKGSDNLAQRIKKVARENNVEIIENKPLARMLYANVEIGEMVPPELYQAVAEVLAMVYQMRGTDQAAVM